MDQNSDAIGLLPNQDLIMVDDNYDEHIIFGEYLKRSELAGVKLRNFYSGEEFLAHMEKVKSGELPMPGVVLLDVRMPGQDGLEVLKLVRTQSDFERDPTILMFSNSNYEKDIQKAQELGANGYVVKPHEYREYIEFLNSLKINS